MGNSPKWLSAVAVGFFVSVGLVGLLYSVLTVNKGLIGWDSPIDTTGFIDITNIPAGSSLGTAYEAVWTTSEFYGILIQQSGLALQCVFTGNCALPDAYAANTYLWQGYSTILLAGLAAVAMATAVFFATKNLVASSITWAFAASFPVVVGLNAVDYKDSPLASGLAIFCAGITILWVRRESLSKWLQFWPSLIIILGGFIALATRPASWTILFAIGVSSTAIFVFVEKIFNKTANKNLVVPVTATYVAALASLIPLYFSNPLAQINIVKWLYDSYVVMSKYPVESSVLTAGQQLNTADLPWWYVPSWIYAQMPIWTLTVLVCLAFITISALIWPKTRKTRAAWPLASFLVLGILVPLVAILTKATMYDGIRHSLYVFGPLAVLMGLGYVALIEISKEHQLFKSITVFVIAGAAITNIVAVAKWFPYQYAYLNEISSINGGLPNWEVDYWGLSQQEAIEKFKSLNVDTVKISGMQPVSMGIYGISNGSPGPGEGLFFGIRGGQTGIVPENCEESFSITREGVLLSKGFVCK